MSKKVAQVIVETLQSAGVKNCYGIVGDTLNTFTAWPCIRSRPLCVVRRATFAK